MGITGKPEVQSKPKGTIRVNCTLLDKEVQISLVLTPSWPDTCKDIWKLLTNDRFPQNPRSPAGTASAGAKNAPARSLESRRLAEDITEYRSRHLLLRFVHPANHARGDPPVETPRRQTREGRPTKRAAPTRSCVILGPKPYYPLSILSLNLTRSSWK